MQSTSPTRRALGILAAGTLGMSTAVLTVTGVAQAAPPTFTASGSGVTAAVPAGICAIQWEVNGGQGGDTSDGLTSGAPGGQLWVTLPAAEGDVFTLFPGTAGVAGTGSAGGAGGTSGYSDPASAGAAGGLDGAVGAGGGGAASVVTKGGSLYLQAFGGDGAGPSGGAGGGGDAHVVNDAAATSTDENNANYFDPASTSYEVGDGTIMGEGIPCAPGTPYLNFASGDNGSLTLNFSDTTGDVTAASYEYTIDDGATWLPLTVSVVDGQEIGTISGLTNGTEYTVKMRALPAAGTGVASYPSQAVTGTPYQPLPAPRNVVATAGPSSIKVTWDAPASGTVARYDVGWSGGQFGGLACEVPAGQPRVCVFPVPAGSNYTASVTAIDADGRRGTRADASPGAVPASSVPATVPTSHGDLERPAGETGSVAVGKKVTLSGSGYLPNSTITVAIYSTPQVLTTVVTDGTGSFTVEVTVPDGLESGNHTLVASGVDSTGTLRYMTLPVTVTGGTTGAGGLAYTGADVAIPAIGGLAALAAGAGLLVVSRRRSTTP